MRIGVLGSGSVGRALARGLARQHGVMLGTREPGADRIVEWLREAPTVKAGTFGEAADFGELLVLATLWEGTENAIRLANPRSFRGKVVLDTTNPLDFSRGMPPTLVVAGSDSAGEQVQRWLPDAKVVKIFNTVGSAHMVDPSFPGGTPDLFICGEDRDAKRIATDLAKSLGWSGTIDLGGIFNSRYLEPMAMVWLVNAANTNHWNRAFKMLTK